MTFLGVVPVLCESGFVLYIMSPSLAVFVLEGVWGDNNVILMVYKWGLDRCSY